MSLLTPAPTPIRSLLRTFLNVIEDEIIPLTARGVTEGNKVFGAAILRKDNLKAVMLATNDEARCPLYHGETNCIRKFYEETPRETRPEAKDCLFLTTHEPCSLCISAITWGGFDNFTYLFTYEDTRDAFAIPYDIDILQAVYQVSIEGESEEERQKRALYNSNNKFFKSQSINQLLEQIGDVNEKSRFEEQIVRIKGRYGDLAKEYAKGKGGKGIPLA